MLGNLIGITIFLVLMLLCRRLWKGRISRRLQYGLWLLAAVRLLMPVGILTNPLLAWGPGAELWRQVSGSVEERIVAMPSDVSHLAEAGTGSAKDGEGSEKGEERKEGEEGGYGEEKKEPGGAALFSPGENFLGENSLGENSLRENPLGEDQFSRGFRSSFAARFLSGLPRAAILENLGKICRIIWILGMGVTAAWILTGAVLFRLRAGRARKLLGKEGRVRIYEAEGLETPCLCAGFPPVIYLTPESMATEARYRHVLTHELTHYRHGDHIWCLVRSLCTVIYWFHPLVWAAGRAWALDCEQACDEGVIARLGEAERRGYGHTLIEMMTGTAPAFHLPRCTTGVAEGKQAMKERLALIVAKRRKFGGMAAVSILTALLLAACSFGGDDGKQGGADVDGRESVDVPGSAGGTDSMDDIDSEGAPGSASGSDSAGEPGSLDDADSANAPGSASGSDSANAPGSVGGSDSANRPGTAGNSDFMGGSNSAGEQGSTGEGGTANDSESVGDPDSEQSAWIPEGEERQILEGALFVAGDRVAAGKVTWELDLNLDGTKDEISLENLDFIPEGDEPETFGDCRIQAGDGVLEFYGDSVAPELMGFSPDGKTILLAVYDNGPSGDPWTYFFRYDGKTLREAGGLSGDLRTLTGESGEDRNASSALEPDGTSSAIVYRQSDGSLRTSIRVDVLQTQLAWGYWIWNGVSLELRQDEEYECLTFGEEGWFTLLEPLTVYDTKSETGTGTFMNPQRVRCIRTDGQNWVCLEAEDGTAGWLYVEKGMLPSMGNRDADELFEGLNHAD